MLGKLKQLKQLRDLHNSLGKEKLDVEKEGIKITINGKMEIETIRLNPDLDTSRQEKVLRECINDAVKKMQMSMAQKMSQFGKMPDLSNLGF